MAVKKKVTSSVERFIENGADVKARTCKDFKNILIRVPVAILNELDEQIQQKPWLNRTQWIIEAIHGKLRE